MTGIGSKTIKKFTLIELLVVIAIISILMTILLPALNVAKKRSTAIKCTGNLKQLGIVAFSYAADSNGYLCSPLQDALTWSNFLKGQGYLNTWDLVKCPTMAVNKQPTHSSYTYALASYIKDSGTTPGYYVTRHYGWWTRSLGSHIPMSRLTVPTEQPIFADSVSLDGGSEGYQNYHFNIDWIGTHCRHFHKANIAFGDGSARPVSSHQLKDDYDNIYGSRTIKVDDNFNRFNR